MTTIQVINILISKGYRISFYKRKDGGYLIRSINGSKFSGAKGNEYARNLLGINLDLSNKGLAKTLKANIEYKQGKLRKPKLSNEVSKSIRKAQRKLNKLQKKSLTAIGTISTKRIREYIAKYGEEEAKRKLNQLINYSRGIAYDENIETLARMIEEYLQKLGNNLKRAIQEGNKLVQLLRANKGLITHDDYYEASRILYDLRNPSITEAGIIDIFREARKTLKI